MIALPELAPARPPCSEAERAGAESLSASLRRLRLPTRIEPLRAPTSPSWVPLLRALLRVWAVALVAAYRPVPAIVLASIAVLAGVPGIAALVRYLPLLGSTTQNVVARIEGFDRDARPLIVTAHLDTHPLAVVSGPRFAIGAISGWIALATAIVGRPALAHWRASITLVAIEALVTLTWLARRELARTMRMPDDNTSGVLALISVAQLVGNDRPTRDLWIVGTGAGTSGGHGITAFLRRYPQLRQGWVIDIDALGSGEVVASPLPARFPRPGTPSQLVRAVVAASSETGDPINVRRVRMPHSDARAALRLRTPAITLTAGIGHPAREPGPDPANAERTARVVDRLVRSAQTPV